MGLTSLFLFVFTLGMRHGLDADHLACIDGMVRHNMRQGRRFARFVGTFFALGHGLVVAMVAVILGFVSQRFTFPEHLERLTTAASIWLLLVVGTLNLVQLLRAPALGASYAPRGLKSKWVQQLLGKSGHPIMVAGIGALFALAADTVTQTSVWVLAADPVGRQMPLWLGLVFMLGMMVSDTLDSLIVHRVLHHFSRWGAFATRGMGYLIVLLAYGVSVYEFWQCDTPAFVTDFGTVSVLVACLFGVVWLARYWRMKQQTATATKERETGV